MINKLLMGIFKIVIGLVSVITAPIDLAISTALPSVSAFFTKVASFFDWVLGFIPWAISYTGLSSDIIQGVILFYTFILTVPLVIHTVKLAIKWFDKLKVG